MTKLNIEIQDNSIADKILWMLQHFKGDGVLIEKVESDDKKFNELEKDLLCAVEDIKQGRTKKVGTIA